MKRQFTLSVSNPCSEQWGTFLTIFHGWKQLLAGLVGLALVFASQQAFASGPPVKATTEVADLRRQETNDPALEDELTVNGVVTDENNEPFPGVNIYVKKNTTIGTLSDESGKFQLSGDIQPGDVIVFSFLGYEPVEYAVREALPELLEIALTDFHIMMGESQTDGPYQKDSQLSQLWRKVKNIF